MKKIFWAIATLGVFFCLDKALAMALVPSDQPVVSPVTTEVNASAINAEKPVVAAPTTEQNISVSGGETVIGGSAGAVSGSAGGGSAPTANMANPASVNCVNLKGTLEIRTDANGGQVGYCNLPGGKTCEEWGLFRGECEGYPAATPSDEQPTDSNGLLTGGAPANLIAPAPALKSQATIVVPAEIQPVAEQAAAADANIRAVKIENAAVIVQYQQPAKLFGFIPIKYKATISADENKNIVVKKPWWLFLTRNNFSVVKSEIVSSFTQAPDLVAPTASEATKTALQQLMDRRSKIISTLSEILQKISKTEDTIISNTK